MKNIIKYKHAVNTKQKIFIKFIEFLNIKKIDYCVLGVNNNFPINIKSDIDLFIDFKDKKNLFKLINKFCNLHKLNVINILQHEINSYYWVIAFLNTSKKIEFIQLDICNEYIVNNYRFLKFNNFKKKTTIKKNKIKFRVLKPEFELTYYLLKKINKLDVDINSFNYIFYLFKKKNSPSLPELQKHFSSKYYFLIIRALKKNNFNFFKTNSFDLRKNLYRKKLILITDFTNIFKLYKERFFNHTGLFLVFLGCDGSGKSTIIKELSKVFTSKLSNPCSGAFRKIRLFHWVPISKFQNIKTNINNPHQQKDYNFFISLIKLIYLFIIFLSGYIINIKRYLISSTLVMHDRSVHDLLIDPKRYRIKTSKFIIKLIIKLLPKPDLIFILDASILKLYKRKKEVSVNILKKLKLNYLKSKKDFVNTHIVNTNQNFNSTEKKVINLILNHMIIKIKLIMKKTTG